MSDGGGDGIELVEIGDPRAQPELVQQVFDDVLRPSFSDGRAALGRGADAGPDDR